jgi:AraC-like DNA-binding protein
VEQTIPAISIKGLIAGLERVGVSRAELLANAGDEVAGLEDAYGSVANSLFGQLWARAFEITGDPLIASRAGFAVPMDAFGLLDHIARNAPTVAAALTLLGEYFRLVATNMSLTAPAANRETVQVRNDPPEPGQRTAEEWSLAIVYARFRTLVPGFTAECVWLPSAPDELLQAYSELWEVPVANGGADTQLILPTGSLKMPIPGADIGLSATLSQTADRIDVRGSARTLRALVESRLDVLLGVHPVSIETVAHDMGVSTRTLQRRLLAERLSFRTVLDDYRRARALLAMREGHTSVAELAFSLGYEEQSSFTRAFRRWTGRAPSELARGNHQS